MTEKPPFVLQTLESLRSKTVECGDCWEWQLCATNGGKNPSVRHGGRSTSARRLALQLAGVYCAPGWGTVTTCGNCLCINPDHLRAVTRKKISLIAGAKGLMSGPVRSAKIAATKRAQSATLTMEQVREIRLHTATHAATAVQYGVHPSKIAAIRQHRIWRDHTNPFAGLGARP